MPLIEMSAPAGSVPDENKPALQEDLAAAVLDAMDLPKSEFFRSATRVYLSMFSAENTGTGSGGAGSGFTVTVTALSGFLDAEKNEALAGRLTGIVLGAAGLDPSHAASVWTVVHEIPEGNWAVGGGITRRAVIDTHAAAARSQLRPAGSR